MGGIFSKKIKKQTRITEVDNQVLTLKMQRDQIVIFRRKLDVQYKAAADAAKWYDRIRIHLFILT
jgi:hypothetical protein